MNRESIRGSEDQGATFVELFFDLVFVFAVTQVTGVLAADLTLGGVFRALIVFWLVWWAWTQYTWSLNAADTERVGVRLYTLIATGIAFIMALTVPELTEDLGAAFCISYVALRALGIGMQWRITDADAALRGAVRKWTVLSSTGLIAVLVAAMLQPDGRTIALAIAALLDVVAATRAGSGIWQVFTSHFTERHGLIVIIALGESLIAAGVAASEGLTAQLMVVGLVAVVTTCCLWWTYFGWAKGGMEEVFAQQPIATMGRFARNVYSFGHFPIIGGVIGFAVAIEESVAHPAEHLETPGIVALVGGITLFIGGTAVALAFAGLRPPNSRLVGTTALVVIGATTFGLIPAWAAMAIAALIVGVIATLERGLHP